MKFIKKLSAYVLLILAVYGFLLICNWDFNPVDWNGFSRVLLAIFIFVGLRIFFDD